MKHNVEELRAMYNNQHLEIIEYQNTNNVYVRCLHCNEIYKTTLESIKRGSTHIKCKKSCGKAHKAHSLEFIKSTYDNEHKEVIEYHNAKDVVCRCRYCGECYTTNSTSLVRHQVHSKCKYVNDKRITPDKLNEKLKKLQDLSPTHVEVLQYNAYNNVVCRCKYCNKIISVSTRSIRNGQVHRDCTATTASHGEICVAEVLNFMNIKYCKEYSFNDCCNIFPLRFDFYIPSLNTCIEYQGHQHFFPVKFPGDTEESAQRNFENGQKNDEIKRQYCKEHNIMLIEIPYTEYDNVENILQAKLNKNK